MQLFETRHNCEDELDSFCDDELDSCTKFKIVATRILDLLLRN